MQRTGVSFAMRANCFVILVATAAVGHAQTFAESDRFGLSAKQLVEMGHETWMTWYCDSSRRGPDSKVGAEQVYCLALHELNTARIAALPQAEQEFFADVRALFSDLAKTAFGNGIALTGYSEAWGLPIAESSTAINEAIWRILSSEQVARPVNESEIWKLIEKTEQRFQSEKPDQLGEAKRFRAIAIRIEEKFASRPRREVALARDFILKMARLAQWSPRDQ